MKRRIIAALTAIMTLFSLASVSYASEETKCDLNGDGKTNTADALYLLKNIALGKKTANGDVNGDGKVNTADALYILKYIANKTVLDKASEYEAEVVRLVNIERVKNGLSELEQDGELDKAADIRAEEIIGYFSHTRPDGSDCFTVLNGNGISYQTVGENIAAGYTTPDRVVEGWMNSPGHRANILNANFTQIGVGFKDDRWVQIFARPM